LLMSAISNCIIKGRLMYFLSGGTSIHSCKTSRILDIESIRPNTSLNKNYASNYSIY
jgi:hypothetical protein